MNKINYLFIIFISTSLITKQLKSEELSNTKIQNTTPTGRKLVRNGQGISGGITMLANIQVFLSQKEDKAKENCLAQENKLIPNWGCKGCQQACDILIKITNEYIAKLQELKLKKVSPSLALTIISDLIRLLKEDIKGLGSPIALIQPVKYARAKIYKEILSLVEIVKQVVAGTKKANYFYEKYYELMKQHGLS